MFDTQKTLTGGELIASQPVTKVLLFKGMLLVLTVHSDVVDNDHLSGEDASPSIDNLRNNSQLTAHLALGLNVALANTTLDSHQTLTGAPVIDDSEHMSMPAGTDKSDILLSHDVESSMEILSIEGHMSMSLGLIYGCHPSCLSGVVEGTSDTMLVDDEAITHSFMFYMSAAIVIVETILTEAHLSSGIVSVEVLFLLPLRMPLGPFIGAISARIIINNIIIIKKSHTCQLFFCRGPLSRETLSDGTNFSFSFFPRGGG